MSLIKKQETFNTDLLTPGTAIRINDEYNLENALVVYATRTELKYVKILKYSEPDQSEPFTNKIGIDEFIELDESWKILHSE